MRANQRKTHTRILIVHSLRREFIRKNLKFPTGAFQKIHFFNEEFATQAFLKLGHRTSLPHSLRASCNLPPHGDVPIRSEMVLCHFCGAEASLAVILKFANITKGGAPSFRCLAWAMN